MSMAAEVARLFARDASLWTNSGEDAWLGWIDAVEEAERGLDELQAWARPLGARYDHIVLCGMGGSSLAPLVIGELHGNERLHVLDSTDPDAVRAVPVEGSLFVIASKSGTTLEPNCFADAFWGKTDGDGSRFVAITDPGSALEERAHKDGWARIAHGRPDVGGRYSALTAFGLVPAALAGIDLAPLVASASAALARCHDDFGVNPGATLATVIGNAHAKGRDKLTFVMPPELASIGLWFEQLIAESTGKAGTGVLPVAGEPLGEAAAYGDDRLFVHLRHGAIRVEPGLDAQDAALNTLRAAGHPVFTQELDKPADVGALFVEWEVATALVGARLHINPFDQPNVQESKDRTVAILEGFARDGKLPAEEPGSLSDVLGHAERGHSYICLQAFVAPTEERQAKLERLQGRLRDALGCAATAGFGPRYLHSTGQYHKGGPPNGVFVQLLASEQDDEEIPGRPFGFRTLRDAQALGDAGALRGRGLPLARISMAACEAAIERALEHIATTRTST
jgi:glucose-6-phosphate isomerase